MWKSAVHPLTFCFCDTACLSQIKERAWRGQRKPRTAFSWTPLALILDFVMTRSAVVIQPCFDSIQLSPHASLVVFYCTSSRSSFARDVSEYIRHNQNINCCKVNYKFYYARKVLCFVQRSEGHDSHTPAWERGHFRLKMPNHRWCYWSEWSQELLEGTIQSIGEDIRFLWINMFLQYSDNSSLIYQTLWLN